MAAEPEIHDDTLFAQEAVPTPYPANGDLYRVHLFEQYKLYVESAQKISDRRQAANSYFLAVNSALLAFIGYAVPKEGNQYLWLVAVAGIALSYLWYRIIRSYRDLNSGKFRVIAAIEQRLPLRTFAAEWEALGNGKRPGLYKPVSHVELGVPWLFLALHLVVVLKAIPWRSLL